MKFIKFLVLIFGSLLFLNFYSKEPVLPKDWNIKTDSGKHYEFGVDLSVYHTGKSSGYITCKKKNDDFGAFVQSCSPRLYLGSTIRMTGYLKCSLDNNRSWAGMWLRLDGKQNYDMLGFDNMSERPLRGETDWTKCEIEMKVSLQTATLNYGILLVGRGKVWVDDISFEIIEPAYKEFEVEEEVEEKLSTNLDFENY